MRRRFLHLLVPTTILLGIGASAAQAELIGVCADGNLCAASEKGKITKLTRDGASSGYDFPSASRDGKVVGYIRAGEPFLGGSRGKRARSLLDTDDGRQFVLSPDGESFVFRTFSTRVGAGGVFLESALSVGGDIGSRRYSSTSVVFTPGFFGESLAVTPAPEIENYGVICTVALIPSNDLPPCAKRIAVQDGRFFDNWSVSPNGKLLAVESSVCDDDFNCTDRKLTLFNTKSAAPVRDIFANGGFRPEFSPDGKQIAFTSGNDLMVAPVKGGKARRLVTGFTDASWTRTAAPGIGSKKLRLKGSRLSVSAKCQTLGGCTKATFVLKRPGAGAVARFKVPALAGGGGRTIRAAVPGPVAQVIRGADGRGLRLKLTGVGGKKRPASVVAVS